MSVVNIRESDFRILIVDDVQANIQVIGNILLTQKYNITFANNGEDAIKTAEKVHLDLILLDVMMPGINGYETCRRLKKSEKAKDVPVIFMTALSEVTDKLEGFRAGAVDYITKPFESEEVLARVRTQLTINKLRQDLELRVKELEKSNKLIRRIFGTYLSDEIVNSILDTPDLVTPGGESRVITILCADLRGFSVISDSLAPASVLEIINKFFAAMTDVIRKYNGTIDELMGDAILALFGAPLPSEDHADSALKCAIEMQLLMNDVNRELHEAGLPMLRVGIGIHSGEVIVGNIGSQKRMKYGVVGRNANLAFRIESYTVGGQVLISEDTYNLLSFKALIKNSFKVNPKGVKKPVRLYDVSGIEGSGMIPGGFDSSAFRAPTEKTSVEYIILDEKSADQNPVKTELLKYSEDGIIIPYTASVKMFDNLKMHFLLSGETDTGDIYGKVTMVNHDEGITVVFTSESSGVIKRII